MRKIMKVLCPLLCLLLLFACAKPAITDNTPREDPEAAAIKATTEQFMTALKAMDTETLKTVVTDEKVIGTVEEGLQKYTALLEKMKLDVDLSFLTKPLLDRITTEVGAIQREGTEAKVAVVLSSPDLEGGFEKFKESFSEIKVLEILAKSGLSLESLLNMDEKGREEILGNIVETLVAEIADTCPPVPSTVGLTMTKADGRWKISGITGAIYGMALGDPTPAQPQ